ncbi:unnamed protein product [Symbiodinium natans]|uniref:Uncharacterized protein n=1 Tax=Symbiodinium natans TaxID=878477 RepID=A0A812IFV2_9DINO|nr:unnamed protein product [Symbiodinium natans]
MAATLDDTVLAQCILRELTHLKVKGCAMRDSTCSSDTETPSPASSQSLSSIRSSSPTGLMQFSPSIAPPPGLAPPPPGLPLPLPLASLVPPPRQPLSRTVSIEMPAEASKELQWQVLNPNAKFKSACGCPLVSQPFQVGELEDVRVIFAPGKQWMTEYCRTTKKHKKSQACDDLPKFGSLQLKISGNAKAGDCNVYFLFGTHRFGPVSSPAGQCTTEVFELPVDWRRELHGGALSIGVEIESA